MTDPIAPTAPEPKPAAQSLTMQGAVVTLVSSLFAVASVLAGAATPDTLGPALIAGIGAAMSILGRLRAGGIAGLFRVPG
jgi:hypothetical protein